MLGVFADDHDSALALNDLALFAHGLNGRSDFHAIFLLLYNGSGFASPGDTTLGKIVRRKLDGYFIAGYDTDEVHTQFA